MAICTKLRQKSYPLFFCPKIYYKQPFYNGIIYYEEKFIESLIEALIWVWLRQGTKKKMQILGWQLRIWGLFNIKTLISHCHKLCWILIYTSEFYHRYLRSKTFDKIKAIQSYKESFIIDLPCHFIYLWSLLMIVQSS